MQPDRSALGDAIAVLTRPREFYRTMPRGTGVLEPLLFLVVVGMITGAVHLGVARLFPGQVIDPGLEILLLAPVVLMVLSLVIGSLLHLVWKLLGSGEPFETAFRCVAYAMAIAPVAVVVGMLPYMGTLIVVLWWALLQALASIEVHGIAEPVAVAVFGIIAVLLILLGVTLELAVHEMQRGGELHVAAGSRAALEARSSLSELVT
ncbi:hypothetical protein B1C78_01950 [Thioalkalivibrio denitrificans]|uniref:Yip1 domain-containing protein n=1 Tax=Thioalkalivibrio denitrificans TaxID=108003 RepID=A0A1V3NSL9_9GAMM|nr:YIP1 family protein [Thioalkalivibrio denitrificans]OOG28105.1 hypothetical protein B1C78_01950 [Thioalkalivibrio denitrificans]